MAFCGSPESQSGNPHVRELVGYVSSSHSRFMTASRLDCVGLISRQHTPTRVACDSMASSRSS